MGNRQMRYGEGGWVLVRALLDRHLAAALGRNPSML
jgi:hypothetical protein